jgi:hypothetical protein
VIDPEWIETVTGTFGELSDASLLEVKQRRTVRPAKRHNPVLTPR